MKSNSKGKINANPFSIVQPAKTKQTYNSKDSSSIINSIISNNTKTTATSLKNTFRQPTSNIKLKTTKNSPDRCIEPKDINFSSPKVNFNFSKDKINSQKQITLMDNEIQLIKDKILCKKDNNCNLSQSKINVKYQTNRQNDKVVADIINDKKGADVLSPDNKPKTNNFSKRSTSTVEENFKQEDLVTSPVRIESLLQKYYNVDSLNKKKINLQKKAHNETQHERLSTTTYNKEFVKKKNQSNNTGVKIDLLNNEKIQHSIKNTPRLASSDCDMIGNKVANHIPSHSKQNSLNSSKVLINTTKQNVSSLNQNTNFVPLLTEISRKNTPKTNNFLISRDMKVGDVSCYSKYNNDPLLKKISNIKLYDNLQTNNINKSKFSKNHNSISKFDNINQSLNLADLKSKQAVCNNVGLNNQTSNQYLNDNYKNIVNNDIKTKPNSKSNSRLEEKADTSRKSLLNFELKTPISVVNNILTSKATHKKVNSNNGTLNNSLLKHNILLNFPPQKQVKSSTNSPKHFSLNFNKEIIENRLVSKQKCEKEIPKSTSKNEDMKNSKYNLKLNLNILNTSLNKTEKVASEKEKKDNHSFDHILNSSTCSGISTIRESNYYKKEAEKLTKYVKHYYNKLGEYPATNLKFYKYGRVLGKGAFGKVNLGLHVHSGRLVAIKSFNKLLMKNENSKKKIFYETNLMKNIRHNSVAKIYEVFENEKYIMIVLEYVCGGDLLSFVRKRTKLNETQAKFIFRQIIEALQYIHSQNIVHRDIKLDNILIDLTNNIKVCDFGVSKQIKKGDIMREQCGTPAYIAPEILKNNGYEGYAVDFWSAGVVLYAMLSGTVPFKAGNMADLHKLILKGTYNPIKDISEEAMNLLKGLLELDPKRRLTAEQILNHPWIRMNNDNGKSKSKMNLFTNAEKVLLTKSNIDYKNPKKDEIIENFTLKNLDTLKDTKNLNIQTKSLILAPFNSSFGNGKFLNSNLKIENEAMRFCGKAKELNRNYELNNNDEIDNGILINPAKNDSIDNNNNNFLSPVSSYHKGKFSNPVTPPLELNEKRISELNSPDSNRNAKNLANTNSNITSSSTFVLDENIVKIIEDHGYKREYLLKSLLMNDFNYVTTFYSLLLNAKLE